MPELTDDQLDGLFRKSAEEFNPPFDPAAWQDMRARLDTNDHTIPGGIPVWKNLLRWGLPVLLLLLIGGGWYAYRKTNLPTGKAVSPAVTSPKSELNRIAKGEPKPEPPRLVDTKQPMLKPTGTPDGKVNEVGQSADRAESAGDLANPENHVNKSTTRLTETTLPTVNEATKRVSAKTTPTTSLDKPRVSDATKSVTSSYRLTTGQKRMSRSRLAPTPVTTTNAEVTTGLLSKHSGFKNSVANRKRRIGKRDLVAFSAINYAIPTSSSFNKQRVRTNRKSVQSDAENTVLPSGSTLSVESNEATSVSFPTATDLAIRPAHWTKLAFTNRSVVTPPDTTDTDYVQKSAPQPAVQRGLSVRFVVAPDLSAVGLKNFTRPGTNIGLLLEYRLASRWSVQAGVIQSTKVYKASTADYVLPEYIKTWAVQPDGIYGRCNMLDIPINLRYDVIVKPRLDGRLPSRWFVSGGVTTYIINKEDYTYDYDMPNDPRIKVWSWSNPTTGIKYGFSNLNLSIGYERAFSRRLSWQIEPFMKVPLRSVGSYKIDLLSTGAFFSLRYKL